MSGTNSDFLTMLLHLNWLDYACLAIIIYLALASASRGIITEVVGFLGLIIAVFAAGQFSSALTRFIPHVSLPSGITPAMIAFVIIFVIILVAARIAAIVLRTAARFMFLGWADWLGGAVLGVLQGVAIVALIFFVIAHYRITTLEPALQASRIASVEGPIMLPVLTRLLPSNLATLHNLIPQLIQ